VTLRAVVERGLHPVVSETKSAAPFKLRRRSFRGDGLQPEFQNAPWDKVREAVYRDRGE